MAQQALDLGHEIVVDLFAGGGGASLGIEWGMNRPVDVAVNHDRDAIAQHEMNHPSTTHYCESVFKVDPVRATSNQPVGLLWASPDCTHHSRAKGGKPVKKQLRGLAWVVVKWARRCRPRVIMCENVEEFADWGPLTEEGKPCKVRKGQQFQEWVRQLERLGYRVEHRTLRACDYGAPTIRKRLFVIARRDGRAITWPKPTHAPADSRAVRRGHKQPYRTAAQCIDWSIPCPSIFTRKKPLAENTQRRIAKGVHRFVLDAAEPFLIPLTHQGDVRAHSVHEPTRTVTGANRGETAVVSPYFIPRHGERDGQEPRTRSADEPMPTVTGTANGASLVAAFMEQANTGMVGHSASKPISTITSRGTQQRVCAVHMMTNTTGHPGARADEPVRTVATGGHHGLVAALIAPYYGSGSGETGRDLRNPSPTVTSKDRLQLVTVTIKGTEYVLTDIGMRMLSPRELYRAQGFPDSYVIDQAPDGRRLTKTAQVKLCGNSVPPHWPAALVAANFVHERKIPEVAA